MNINETSKEVLLEKFKSYYDTKSITAHVLKTQYNFVEGILDDPISVNIGDTLTFVEEDKIICKVNHKVATEEFYLPINFELVGEGESLEKQLQSIVDQDDKLFTSLLFQSCDLCNAPVAVYSMEALNFKLFLEELEIKVERHRLLSDKFICNRRAASLFKTEINAIDWIPAESLDLRSQNLYGSIWGVNIFILPMDLLKVPVVFCVANGACLGSRRLSDVYLNENNNLVVKGSMFIMNSKAISCGTSSDYLKIELDRSKL